MKKFVGVNLFFIVILSFTIHAMTVFGLDGAVVNGQYGKMVTGIRVPETICSIAKGELQKKREKPAGNKGSSQNRWGIQLDEIELDMIARITMLEAGAEPDRGQQAVVEVILNRMYSDQFPDTVYEVLSQKDNGCSQFVTWKNRNMDAAKPAERVKRNVKAVLDGETQILPFKTMYFSLEKENGHIQCVIGNHVFCNQT